MMTCILSGADPHPAWVVPATACAGQYTSLFTTALLIHVVLDTQTPLLCAENTHAQQADNPFADGDLESKCPHHLELTVIANNTNAAVTVNTSATEVQNAISKYMRAFDFPQVEIGV